jgi:hypothetical protein
MANCVCAHCKRIMDCTGETLCDLCEIAEELTIVNAVLRHEQEMRRMRAYDVPTYTDEVWDTQP